MSDQKSMTSRLMVISSSSPGREREMATQAETLEWHKKRWGQRSSDLSGSSTARASRRTMCCCSSCRWTATWTRPSWRRSAWSLTSLQVLAARWEIEIEPLTKSKIDHSKRWLPSQGTVWPPFARFTTIEDDVFVQI